MAEQVPNFLTIEEAARVLRIGRTKAYAMGQEWRVTNGKSGIKVREVGGQLRVPKAWLEAQLDAPLLFIPEPPQRTIRHDPGAAPAPPGPEPTPSARDPSARDRSARDPSPAAAQAVAPSQAPPEQPRPAHPPLQLTPMPHPAIYYPPNQSTTDECTPRAARWCSPTSRWRR